MTQIRADAIQPGVLTALTDPVSVVNEAGEVIGIYTPVRYARSPYPREEIERRRSDRSGKPLSEILARLEGRAG